MTQGEEINFKLATVIGACVTVAMIITSMLIAQQAGITTAVDRSVIQAKEYTNLRIAPIETDIKTLKENQDEIKKKLNEFHFR